MGRITAGGSLAEVVERGPEELRTEPPRVRVLEQRPKPKPRRNRDWERREQAQGRGPVTFRNVPWALRDAVKEVAERHGLRVGEVARLFLEVGLGAYEAGELELETTVEGGRLTLYPGEG